MCHERKNASLCNGGSCREPFHDGGTSVCRIYATDEKGNRPYTLLPSGPGTTVYTANDFYTTPNPDPNARMPDPDDGFVVVQLPFPFEYNGTIYNYIAINVNGFIMFLDRPNVPLGSVGMDIATRLFDRDQFPRNVVAPFWGNHYMRVGPQMSQSTCRHKCLHGR